MATTTTEELETPDMSLEDITDGDNGRGIPAAKFIDDVASFSLSLGFQPKASPELLIVAYTQLLSKYRSSESNLQSRQEHLKGKVPELDRSLTLVKDLLAKMESGASKGKIRYNLADNIFAKAEIEYGTVYLWLGANVTLEYTYQEAIEFLQSNHDRATRELDNVSQDLAFVRDQIVTSEVNISRIHNFDVRRKRAKQS